MVYRHFEVMKSIWGGSSNVEPAPLRINSKLEDGNNANEDSHKMVKENLVINAIILLLPHTTTNDSDSNDNDNGMENPDAAKSLAEGKYI